MGRILLILFLVVVGVILIDRFLLQAESRRWIYWRRRSRSGAAAFEAMNEVLLTGAPRFVEEKEAQSVLAVEAEEGTPPSPEGRRDDSSQETRE